MMYDNEEENKHLKLKKRVLHGVYEADQCGCRCEMS